MKLTGSCFCRAIVYEINLKSPDDATTSLCHCGNCKKAYGTNYGLTTEVPRDAFTYTQGKPKEHAADNGSGIVVTREFCDTCGSLIIEYGVSPPSTCEPTWPPPAPHCPSFIFTGSAHLQPHGTACNDLGTCKITLALCHRGHSRRPRRAAAKEGKLCQTSRELDAARVRYCPEYGTVMNWRRWVGVKVPGA
ncbi:Mss4-like protein [Phyllosticta capitalensis]